MNPIIKFYEPKNPYGELSNFYKHKNLLQINNKTYKTVEHYFQSQKFENIDEDYAELIRTSNTPRIAKLLAHQVKQYQYPWQIKIGEKMRFDISIRPDWEIVKDDVMYTGLFAKFSQDKHCMAVLSGTENASLIESSTKDEYWGCGSNGMGLNRLGKLLEIIRERF